MYFPVAHLLTRYHTVIAGRRNRSLDNQSGSGSQPVPSSGSLLSESRRLSTKATPHKPISSLSAKELLELELKRQKEFDDGFKRVSELEEQEGSTVTSDWIQEAGRLVEGFRQAQILFPSDRVTPSFDSHMLELIFQPF